MYMYSFAFKKRKNINDISTLVAPQKNIPIISEYLRPFKKSIANNAS